MSVLICIDFGIEIYGEEKKKETFLINLFFFSLDVFGLKC